MFWLWAVCACGSSPKRDVVPDMTEPAWVDEYATRAEAGCACEDAACLDKVHGELAAMVTKHGGFDDAPQGVHVAHGKFDKCWREGTRDVSRDFENLAQMICSCTTSECLRLATIEQNVLLGKYRETLAADLQTNSRLGVALLHAGQCIAKVTMPAADAIELFTRSSDAMCSCTDLACAGLVMKQRDAALARWVDIDGAVDRDQLGAQQSRFCDCWEKAAIAEVTGKSPVPALTVTSVSVDFKCR
jgi:hypothetical protein